jgi:membrane protein
MKASSLALLGAVAVAVGAVSKKARAPIALVTPAETPQRSGNILVRVYQDATQDRLFAVAAGVAFYALLAIAPALAVAVSVFGLFADPAQLAGLSQSLAAVLPAEAAKLVQDEAMRLASQPHPALSIKLGIALLLSLWSASAAVRSCFDALNVIDGQEEQRSLVRLYATAVAATLLGVIVFLLSLAVIGASPKFVAFGALSQQTVWLYTLLRWPIFFCVAVVVIAALYWVGPSRPPAPFSRLLPGAALAALLWAAGSSLFGWYVSAMGNYSATYGSLATVAVVMTWLWVSASVVLLGAQFNFERARR